MYTRGYRYTSEPRGGSVRHTFHRYEDKRNSSDYRENVGDKEGWKNATKNRDRETQSDSWIDTTNTLTSKMRT